MAQFKIYCTLCNWMGVMDDLMTFNGSGIHHCPRCNGMDCYFPLCDQKGCNSPGIVGTQTSEGFRTTCIGHKPNEITTTIHYPDNH